eukprot:11204004-Lingulodinium_polyedra.AAC.1
MASLGPRLTDPDHSGAMTPGHCRRLMEPTCTRSLTNPAQPLPAILSSQPAAEGLPAVTDESRDATPTVRGAPTEL